MKKFVAFVLALVMVLSLCTVAMAGEPKTLKDIVSPYLPESNSTTPPQDAWENEKGAKIFIYIMDTDLSRHYLYTAYDERTDSTINYAAVLNEGENKYTYGYGGKNLTFNMSGNELVSIEISGYTYNESFNGTYTAPKTTDCNIFPLIGAYWTAKYICEKVSEVATTPYFAPLMKIAVPTAVMAVIGHVLCHMGAPK